MEGPFLDPSKKGAHVEGYIRKPDIGFFKDADYWKIQVIQQTDYAVLK